MEQWDRDINSLSVSSALELGESVENSPNGAFGINMKTDGGGTYDTVTDLIIYFKWAVKYFHKYPVDSVLYFCAAWGLLSESMVIWILTGKMADNSSPAATFCLIIANYASCTYLESGSKVPRQFRTHFTELLEDLVCLLRATPSSHFDRQVTIPSNGRP